MNFGRQSSNDRIKYLKSMVSAIADKNGEQKRAEQRQFTNPLDIAMKDVKTTLDWTRGEQAFLSS